MSNRAAGDGLADQALRDLEKERALLEQLRQKLMAGLSQLQFEESDLIAQLTALSAPTTTVGLREEIHEQLFGSSQPLPQASQAHAILSSLIADEPQTPAGQLGAAAGGTRAGAVLAGPGHDDDDDDDDDEEDAGQRWIQTQERLRQLNGGVQ
jgi:hypothetical protein